VLVLARALVRLETRPPR